MKLNAETSEEIAVLKRKIWQVPGFAGQKRQVRVDPKEQQVVLAVFTQAI